MYQKIIESADYIKKIAQHRPSIGIILGSGLGVYVDVIENKTIIPYQQIPHFKDTTVEGHQGRLILGTIQGKNVAVLQGRIHAYEGHPMETIVHPTRTLAMLGIESIVLTNAAGGINPDFKPGDLIAIKDHINLTGKNPLIGPNINELGPRFPDMTRAYHPELLQAMQRAADKTSLPLKEGVYCSLLGPTYETPAEINMLKILGADMVGMSTVVESIAANHLGLKVAGISCITNYAAGIKEDKLDHKDVKVEAQKAMYNFSELLTRTIIEMPV